MNDILERSEEALRNAHADMNPEAVAEAANRIVRARRIGIYGLGLSGFLAMEAQYRLSLLGLAAVAHSDPVVQGSTAPLLGESDVVLALSFSGLTQYLVETNRSREKFRRPGRVVVAERLTGRQSRRRQHRAQRLPQIGQFPGRAHGADRLTYGS
ncbi:MAG: SIS domain-containing protein [Mesorhizobium sp.]